MKKVLTVLLVLGLLGFASTAQATYNKDLCDTPFKSIINRCEQPDIDDNKELFDKGVYLHLIFWESADGNYEVGNLNTYEIHRKEFTSLLGAKIYLNRLTYQKPDVE